MRIRHYGLLANRSRRQYLERIRQALPQQTPAMNIHKPETPAQQGHDVGLGCCEKCHACTLRLIREWPPLKWLHPVKLRR
jgi:hypothetical protein